MRVMLVDWIGYCCYSGHGRNFFGFQNQKNMQNFGNRNTLDKENIMLMFVYDCPLFSCSQFKSTINKL